MTKKKLISVLLCLAAMASLLCPGAFAEGSVTLSCEAVENSDSACTVEVKAENIEGTAMLQFCIHYDAEALKFDSSAFGDVFQSNGVPTINTSQPGQIYLAWDSLTPLSKDGTVLTLRFEKLTGAGANVVFNRDESTICAYSDFTQAELNTVDCYVEASGEEAPETEKAESGENDGLTLSDNTLDLKTGKSYVLKTDAEDLPQSWESSDASVVSVSPDGTVSALKPGKSVITVIGEDGTKASCVVTVKRGTSLVLPGLALVLIFAAALILFLKKKAKAAPTGAEAAPINEMPNEPAPETITPEENPKED